MLLPFPVLRTPLLARAVLCAQLLLSLPTTPSAAKNADPAQSEAPAPQTPPQTPVPISSPGDPAPPESEPRIESKLVTQAVQLAGEDKLPSAQNLKDWLQNPSGAAPSLPAISTTNLSPREIAKRAAAAYLRVGWVYQCSKCSRWHTNLAGGYAIAPDVIATAHHVLSPPEKMKPGSGHPIAVKGEDEVLIIQAVVAADADADVALLRVNASSLVPLPLNPDIEVGDPVYCLSEPNGERPYFSAGIVNRFGRETSAKSRTPQARRINVSTDWAPGSSGAAILDTHGNAIGHVSSISTITGSAKGPEKNPHYITLHWAIPAEHLLRLTRPPRHTQETQGAQTQTRDP